MVKTKELVSIKTLLKGKIKEYCYTIYRKSFK